MNNSDINLAAVFNSLANDTRLSIVRKLAQEEKVVDGRDIVISCAQFLKLSQPTMSHHFSKLVQAGVIIEQKIGVEKKYRLNHKLLDQIGINVKKF